jgi:DNA-binding NtrC family response regulator
MEDQDVRSLLEHEAVRVLFVDDDQSVIRAYGSALAHDGVTVETASINVGYYPAR